MVGYICSNCGFKTESQKPAKSCPYCDSLKIEKEKTAEELLESIED